MLSCVFALDGQARVQLDLAPSADARVRLDRPVPLSAPPRWKNVYYKRKGKEKENTQSRARRSMIAAASDEQWDAAVAFAKKPRVVELLGMSATSTYNGVAVAARWLVLQRLAAPLEA